MFAVLIANTFLPIMEYALNSTKKKGATKWKQKKKRFSETRFYPIFFMLVTTIFFVGILAVFYHSTEARVLQYEEQSYKKAMMHVFNLSGEDISNFDKYFEKKRMNSRITLQKAEMR